MSRLGQELIQGMKEAVAYVNGQERLENYRISPRKEVKPQLTPTRHYSSAGFAVDDTSIPDTGSPR